MQQSMDVTLYKIQLPIKFGKRILVTKKYLMNDIFNPLFYLLSKIWTMEQYGVKVEATICIRAVAHSWKQKF
jgi:hypothetical protein